MISVAPVGSPARAPVARRTVSAWLPFSSGEETTNPMPTSVRVGRGDNEAEDHIRPQIAVVVDVDGVDGVGVEALPHARDERIRVHDEDAPAEVVRRLKGEEISEVEAAVFTRRLEPRAGEMVRHDSPLSAGCTPASSTWFTCSAQLKATVGQWTYG